MMDAEVIKSLQQQLALSMFKAMLFFVVPVIGSFIVGYFLQLLANRKTVRSLLAAFEKQLDNKVDHVEFRESIKRVHDERERDINKVHERIDDHIERDNTIILQINNDLSYLRGWVEKNGRPDN